MQGTGLRMDLNQLRRKIEKIGGEVRVESFKPILMDFARKSLSATMRNTPARSSSLIRRAQKIQYAHRVNYIPSFHTLSDPTLIVKGDALFLYAGGKWFRPDKWKLPDEVWQVFQQLLSERDRRMQKSEADFIASREQARFLYKLSWVQVGESLGLSIAAPTNVRNSLTRRKPPKNPPRGYAQIRGGKTVLSIVIFNPFAQSESDYKDWDAAKILAGSIAKYEPAYKAQLERQLSRILYAVMHS